MKYTRTITVPLNTRGQLFGSSPLLPHKGEEGRFTSMGSSRRNLVGKKVFGKKGGRKEKVTGKKGSLRES